MTNIRSSSFALFTSLSLAGFGLAGCGDEVAEPAEAQARISSVVPQLVGSIEEAGDSMESIAAVGSLAASVDAMSSMAATPISYLRVPESSALKALFALEPSDGETTAPEAAMAESLNELFFNENSYEGDGYYRVRGEALCQDDDGVVQQECVAKVDHAELRIRALLAGDGLDLTLLVGPDRAAPIEVTLRSDRAVIMLDLTQAKAALAHIGNPEVTMPEVFEGVLTLSLTVHGPKDITLAGSIPEGIRVANPQDSAGSGIFFSTEAKDPLFSVRMNGAESKLGLGFDIGRTIFSMPWDMATEGTASSMLSADLGGLSASATISAGDTSARISNIGLGDTTTTIKLDDQVVFWLDLNADLGRRFALDITPNDQGLASLALDPGFDLSLGFDVSPQVATGEEPGQAPILEDYHIALTGDRPTVELVRSAAHDYEASLRVSSGTLSIASNTLPAPLTVEAGRCLVPTQPAPDANPVLFGGVGEGACP